MSRTKPKVVVAMSGGVDSSLAAALLVQQGYSVVGMMLRLWSEDGHQAFNRCCTPESMGLARRIAARLEIPFYPVDVRQTFRETVVQYFIDGYARGETPNPCLVCNRSIRWGALLEHARALGADVLATGHYAQLKRDASGKQMLFRGADPEKDQSYVLSGLSQVQLQAAMFPIGHLTKDRVREIAEDFGLPTASRPDSQDLCFVTGGDYRAFLRRHAPHVHRPGPIFNRSGEELGRHDGLADYTIGQRKGLGLSAAKPLYVLEKDLARNALIVGFRDEQGRDHLVAEQFNWIQGYPPAGEISASVKVRYRTPAFPAEIRPIGQHQVEVRFRDLVRDITPGQVAAVFDGDLCLGGGIIRLEGR